MRPVPERPVLDAAGPILPPPNGPRSARSARPVLGAVGAACARRGSAWARRGRRWSALFGAVRRCSADLGSPCAPGLIRPMVAWFVAHYRAWHRPAEVVHAQIATKPDPGKHNGPSVGHLIGHKSPSATALPSLARPAETRCDRTCRGAHHHVAARSWPTSRGRPPLAVHNLAVHRLGVHKLAVHRLGVHRLTSGGAAE